MAIERVLWMKALKTGLLLSLAILFSVACGTTETANQNANKAAPPQSANTSPPSTSAPAANNNQASGAPGGNAAVLYAEQGCVACHGRAGKPTLKQSPDFTDPAWQQKASDDAIFKAIKNGKPPLMQGYGSKLSDEQIRALVAHTRSFAKK